MIDVLQPLPVEKWPLLLDLLKEDWPNYAYYYNWVLNAMNWKRKNPSIRHRIYCPFGKHETGIFIGIPDFPLYKIIVFSLKNSRALLKRVLMETTMIDWNRERLLFVAVHVNFADVVLSVISKKIPDRVTEKWVMEHYFKPKEECAKMKYKVPDEYELRYLETPHVPLVASKWDLGKFTSYDLVQGILRDYITLNRGIGLFSKMSNSPVSWITQTEWGGMGALATLDNHKCKGYGKIVVQALAKEMAEKDNLNSAVFILEKNEPSKRLFQSLGYKRVCTINWLHVTPKKNSKF